MCSDFLYQLRSHRRHFVKFVLCLCLFLCVKHVSGNWKGRRLWTLGMCYQVRFITRSVKCMVTMRWVIAWLRNGFGCSMKDERTCTMRRELCVHLWWMMIWCVRSTKECVTTDVSQFLICPCTFLRFQGLYSMTLSIVIWVAGGRILWGGYTKLVSRYGKCLNNDGEYVEKLFEEYGIW